MSASRRRAFYDSRAPSALSRAPCIKCQSVSGIAGTVVSTRRATTFTSDQPGSIVAIRETLARTAMIFAARSDPIAIVFIDTEYVDGLRFPASGGPPEVCEAEARERL